MKGAGWVALGALAGAIAAAFCAPHLRPFFSVPAGGVGAVTVAAYPKGWDYAVIALLVLGTGLGGGVVALLLRRDVELPLVSKRPRGVLLISLVVFVLMLFAHDHPYALMDPFHEGEHLTAGDLMRKGERPYRDFFVFHGLATDAGLDALAMSAGERPSILRVRRLQTILDAATLALLVPIAAEVTASAWMLVVAVFFSLCGAAAFWLPVFPYYRLAPVLLAAWGLLRYARNGRAAPLFAALASGTLGVLWSLDTGMYALTATGVCLVLMRLGRLEARPIGSARFIAILASAATLPLLVLLLVRADLRRFFVDSFVIMPRSIDATWALPGPAPFTENGIHYFVPPIVYGLLLALGLLAWRRKRPELAATLAILAVFSILLFRTASGRVSWSHTRFSAPFLGIAAVAFLVQPLWLARRRVAATVVLALAFVFLEVPQNCAAGVKLLASWSARQRHEGLVPYPMKAARGIFAAPENARDLAALQAAIDSLGPKDASILDFSNERALYYLLQRKPALRCMEISMLSNPTLLAEAMAQLNANPPVAVVVSGYSEVAAFDGVSNRTRVPDLAAWIDSNYPTRVSIGRFVLATR
jgi:hypothetical protein